MKIASVIAATVIILVLATIGQAATVYDESLSYGPSSPRTQGTLTFDQYNGGIEVTEIIITVSLTSQDASVYMDNEGESVLAEYTTGARNDVTSALFNTIIAEASQSGSQSLGADDGDDENQVNPGGLDYYEVSGQTLNDTVTLNITNSSDIQAFLGSGTFDVGYDITSVNSVSGGINFTNIVGTGSGTVRIQMVPEPATLGLLTLGGLGLLIRHRRRGGRTA